MKLIIRLSDDDIKKLEDGEEIEIPTRGAQFGIQYGVILRKEKNESIHVD